MTPEIKAEFQMFVPEDDGSAMDWLENTLTQDRAALHTSLIAAVKEKSYKPWDHYNDIPGKVEMIELEDLLTIINSIFKE